MDNENTDKRYNGLKLTDEQLDLVIGGVSFDAGIAMVGDSRLQMGSIRQKPRIKR